MKETTSNIDHPGASMTEASMFRSCIDHGSFNLRRVSVSNDLIKYCMRDLKPA